MSQLVPVSKAIARSLLPTTFHLFDHVPQTRRGKSLTRREGEREIFAPLITRSPLVLVTRRHLACTGPPYKGSFIEFHRAPLLLSAMRTVKRDSLPRVD